VKAGKAFPQQKCILAFEKGWDDLQVLYCGKSPNNKGQDAIER